MGKTGVKSGCFYIVVSSFYYKMNKKSPNKFALKAVFEWLNEIRLSEPKLGQKSGQKSGRKFAKLRRQSGRKLAKLRRKSGR